MVKMLRGWQGKEFLRQACDTIIRFIKMTKEI